MLQTWNLLAASGSPGFLSGCTSLAYKNNFHKNKHWDWGKAQYPLVGKCTHLVSRKMNQKLLELWGWKLVHITTNLGIFIDDISILVWHNISLYNTI